MTRKATQLPQLCALAVEVGAGSPQSRIGVSMPPGPPPIRRKAIRNRYFRLSEHGHFGVAVGSRRTQFDVPVEQRAWRECEFLGRPTPVKA